MKAPLSWLKEYVDICVTPEELEKKLFSCGLEVEETIYFGKNIDKIVVAKILKTEKHPSPRTARLQSLFAIIHRL